MTDTPKRVVSSFNLAVHKTRVVMTRFLSNWHAWACHIGWNVVEWAAGIPVTNTIGVCARMYCGEACVKAGSAHILLLSLSLRYRWRSGACAWASIPQQTGRAPICCGDRDVMQRIDMLQYFKFKWMPGKLEKRLFGTRLVDHFSRGITRE